ncbi:unnamed protein product [Trifolium pratense]|uniref:Uncharacterized protein n=1 Tax=Trifolium pratense TaxID=57577 RepID=A0ACB0K8V2_TRIPR|nr:unnamed protein product [Trifolium pratense]
MTYNTKFTQTIDKCFINNTTFSIHMLIPNHVHINTQHITILVSTKFHIFIHLFFSYNFFNMKHFHFFLFLSLLFLTPKVHHAIRIKFSSPSSSHHHVFHIPFFNSPIRSKDKDFKSEKRKVPTGSNPLHNKRR